MEKIKGYIDHIVYQNEENGYTVMTMVVDEEELTVVGNFRGLDPGETLELEGQYTEHPVYGRQFRASSFERLAPEDVVSIMRYLSSGAIRGIGEALASRIVKKFGADTLRIMEEEPERLSEVKGISSRIACAIGEQMEEKKDLRAALMFLQKYGISNTLAAKIYNTYGMGLYGIMRENPYRLAEDIEGVGFRLADEIAEKIGIHTDSDYRICSGILYTLMQAAGEGHVYLPAEKLLQRAAVLLGLMPEQLDGQLENLAMDRKIVLKKDGEVYLQSYYYAEMNCARMLVDLNVATEIDTGLLPSEENALLDKIRRIEKNLDIALDDLQRHAVLESRKHGVLLLSGGPGTGKTTTINTMIRYFEQEGADILLAAPTGRAAKRMTEATGYEARTIHRMLELSGGDAPSVHFERNQNNPLEADVVIIDEMSMVDIFLFQSLLKAIAPGTRLILVGDMDQLPSVGPGQVLRDIFASGQFPSVVLSHIFRQAGESDIVQNAHRINRGEKIALDNKSRDFFFLERNDVNVIYKHMVQLVRDKLPSYVGAGPMDVQVLTPMRKGALGVETLNNVLQEYLNPPSADKKEHARPGGGVLREGDKVMQIRNNYQLEWEVVSRYNIPIDKGAGIFNGDVGWICRIDEFAQQLTVEFDEKRRVSYPFSELDELELAYAVTIHKSQGSEYPAVVMPLLTGPRMLFTRKLLYTAVTRARSCVTILGASETVRGMVENNAENERYSSLDKRILEISELESEG